MAHSARIFTPEQEHFWTHLPANDYQLNSLPTILVEVTSEHLSQANEHLLQQQNDDEVQILCVRSIKNFPATYRA